jgi:Carboxypeptidase regulatory-like domain
MNAIIRVAMLCVLAVAVSGRPASACSCAMRPACAAFWEADRVFIGRAEVTSLGPGAQRARFQVEEAFRGPRGSVEIVARGIGGSCAYAFVHGARYLVYARRAPDGTWSSFFCDPTAPLDQAGEDLAFARGVARDNRRVGSLSGSVSITERARDGQVGLPAPLSRVTIVIREGTQALSTTTDSQGQYAFKDVAPGRYTLTVSELPGVDPIPPATIQIKGPGACVVLAVTAVRRPPR